MKRIPIVSLFLAVVHTSSGLLILIFSSWFIAACALMPVNFNYMLPAVIIRALALIRIGAGYGHMWLAHHDLLGRTTWLRSTLFHRLKDQHLPDKSGDVERLAAQTETLSSVWVGWVAHQASALVLILLSVSICSYLALPGYIQMWLIAGAWLLLTIWLIHFGFKKAAQQTLMEGRFRFESEHFFDSSSLWHLQLQENNGVFQQAPDLRGVWRHNQVIESAGQWALWLLQGLAIGGIFVLFAKQSEQGFGEPTALIVPMLLLSISDWLGRPISTAAHYGKFHQAKVAIDNSEAVSLPHRVESQAVNQITLDNFQARTLKDSLTATLPTQGLVIVSGASGCGKSSLLKALAGLTPAKGSMHFDSEKVKAGRRDGWVYVEQTPVILEATVMMNLCPADASPDTSVCRHALHTFGLDHLNNLKEWLGKGGRRLSGGEAKRLSLARAFIAAPRVWLVDEPFEGLDEHNQEVIAGALIAQSEHGLVVIATHLVPDAIASQHPQCINL